MCVCVLPECLYMHEHDLHAPLCLSTGVFYRSVEPYIFLFASGNGTYGGLSPLVA